MNIKFFHGHNKLFNGTAEAIPRKDEIVTFKTGRYRVTEVAHAFWHHNDEGTTADIEITLETAEDERNII